MPVLNTTQRSALEKTVVLARQQAETGARNALRALAVDQPEPYAHTTPDQRALRNRLRAKARLLGDALQTTGHQEIGHLAYELAYEYWHRMLFAKFLEANHLLIHTEGVAVTMEDCAELAPEEGYADKWTAAAAYASRMLPAIFRPDDPLMQVDFATEDRIRLETLLESIPNDTFTADDSLGWVYQFWQNEAKTAINASGDKIDGARLPAVTQLFTEPYMVHFLIDNTIGAWWTSRHPGETPPVKFDYLRSTPPPSPPPNGRGARTHVASESEKNEALPPDNPETNASIQPIPKMEQDQAPLPFGGGDGGGVEPAAGNFPGWPDRTSDITTLDPCMGSGHFVAALFPVLARLRMHEEGLSADEATDRVIAENLHGLELDPRCTQIAAFNLALTAWKFCDHYKPLPEMNLACSGIAPKGKLEDWLKLVGRETDLAKKQRLENGLTEMYRLFQQAPELGSLLNPAAIKPDIFTANFEELQPYLDDALDRESDQELLERGVLAAGIALAGKLLAQKYTLQITNVPYLARGKQDAVLTDYCEKNYAEAKGDLATVFLDRMLKTAAPGGTACSVIPQNWLFQSQYSKFRKRLLENFTWDFVVKLGARAFKEITGEVVKVNLNSLTNLKPSTENCFLGFDLSEKSNADEKQAGLINSKVDFYKQGQQLKNPEIRIVFDDISFTAQLAKYAQGLHGQGTFDKECYTLTYWELNTFGEVWEYQQTTPKNISKDDFGASRVFRWEKGKGMLYDFMELKKQDGYTSGKWKAGTQIWGKTGLAVSGMGRLFFTKYLGYAFDENVAVLFTDDEKILNYINAYCFSGNFENELKKIDQNLKASCNTLVKVPFDLDHWQKVAAEKYPNGLPQPYSDDPTQWLFHGHPVRAARPLQVALARLLGYRWPAENDPDMELAPEARALIGAVQAFNPLSDEDGIVCIPPVNGEYAGAERLRAFLQAVYGEAWSNTTLAQLLAQEGSKKTNLEDWLREEFFEQHFKLFHHRPFLWHIWDGRKDGFSAIVNYHRLTKENLQKLIYTYLGDWLRQCDAKVKAGESGAEGLRSAAQHLKEKLERILEGEPPYDIFVRWKPIEQQPLGWDPDLNDGVRLNIRPFLLADVLRKKPNIKWGVDRGKNPPGSAWGEVRDNDVHLTLAEKRAAREK